MQNERSSRPQQAIAETPASGDQVEYDLDFLDVETCPAANLRPAWLAFRYESAVLDGGHLEFFAGGGFACAQVTRRALQMLGCGRQAEILAAAAELYRSQQRPAHYGLAELLSAVSLGEFCLFDGEIERCFPTIEASIKTYLREQADTPRLQVSRRG